ncbi:hypothetical protein YSA_09339 [Pseudomonas putida ND6]|uniref:Uncharacterized protein n=1 Tax=Pseudomonas putida ND6 TaxID=231023 RepID=I3V249_PSEPU|nr:hypothetical protein YSA_09339 [Pseudomonas putida ND6]
MVIRTSQCSEALSYIKCALTLSRKVLYQITGHGREPQYRDLSLNCIPLLVQKLVRAGCTSIQHIPAMQQ